MLKHLNNKGLTLLEVLLALTISTLIIGLVTSVMISSFNNHSKNMERKIAQQDINLLMQAITTTVENKKEPFKITADKDNQTITIDEKNYQFNNSSIVIITETSCQDGEEGCVDGNKQNISSTIPDEECSLNNCISNNYCNNDPNHEINPRRSTKLQIILYYDTCKNLEVETRLIRLY